MWSADKSSYLAQTTSSTTQSVATPTPSVARHVGQPAEPRVAAAAALVVAATAAVAAVAVAAVAADSGQTDRCSPPPAHSADRRPRCLSSRAVTDRCTATLASRSSGSPAAGRRQRPIALVKQTAPVTSVTGAVFFWARARLGGYFG